MRATRRIPRRFRPDTRARRVGRRLAMVVGAMAAVAVALAGPASAHVTVDPESVPKGTGDVVLTFRVPNEEADADTVKVAMQLPLDHPIALVDVRDADGWTATVTTKHLTTPISTDDGTFSDVASRIVWSGGKISPGHFETFEVLAQGIPDDATSLAFPTIQTYSNGDTVSWIDPEVEGGPEAEHPVPTVTLTKSSEDGTAAPTTTTVVKKQTSAIGVVALVVALIALVAAAAGLALRGRSRPTTQT